MIRVRQVACWLILLNMVACGRATAPDSAAQQSGSNANSPVALPAASPTASPNVLSAEQRREWAAQPQGKVERVEFARGRDTAIMRGVTPLAGFDRYTVAAYEGQQMSVQVRSEEDVVKFQVYASDDDTGITGIRGGTTRWSGRLPHTSDYEIEVGSRWGGNNYTLTISIQ